MENYLIAIYLGLVQGITEFLPISSTAHLIMLEKFLHLNFDNKLLEVFVQLGSVLALFVLRFQLIWQTITTVHKDQNSQKFTLNLIISILPVVICGAIFHNFITELYNPKILWVSFIIGGIVLLVAYQQSNPSTHTHDFLYNMPKLKALGIGIMQAIALIPGISRSGATISGGIFLGLARSKAIEYSFLLSIPTIFAANVYSLYQNIGNVSNEQMIMITISFICSFISSLFFFNIMIRFLNKQGLLFCGIYRIILGLIMIYYTLY